MNRHSISPPLLQAFDPSGSLSPRLNLSESPEETRALPSASVECQKGVAAAANSTAKDTAAASAADYESVGIEEWLRSAIDGARSSPSTQRNAHLTSAVELACAIAKRLDDLVKNTTDDVPLGNIQARNVLVVLPGLLLEGRGKSNSIIDIQFLAEGTPRHGEPSCMVHDVRKGNRFQSREACARLGEILLEVFTLSHYYAHDVEKQPPQKKRRAVEENGAALIPTKSYELLRDMDMPSSICQLVHDLLDATDSDQHSTRGTVALTVLDEALWELSQMKSCPETFLFDRMCLTNAMERFQSTNRDFFGRESELKTLMSSREHVSTFVCTDTKASTDCNFLCEAAYLSGLPGSGKSSLLQRLVDLCTNDGWFVLRCKFDKQTPALKILAKAFNDFFEWGRVTTKNSGISSPIVKPFHQVCGRIFSATIDDDVFHQLAALVPSFERMFPLMTEPEDQDRASVSLMEKAGSAKKRLHNLLNILLEALCSVGRPVLLVLDDLQWSTDGAIEALSNFVLSHTHDVQGAAASGESWRQRRGIFLVGAYRSNEINEDSQLIKSIEGMEKHRTTNVNRLTVGELSKDNITKLLSSKLGLPWRYTKELARIVHTKTRGNAFFITQFLQSILQNELLQFSLMSGKWTWDSDVIDMQIISDGVAELLATTFDGLPSRLQKTLKIAACLGWQVNESAIVALDSDKKVLPFCMLEQLELAVQEGIMERAGPVFQFAHDLVQSFIYDRIPKTNKNLLHKTIGKNLMRHAADNSEVHLLAVDQINLFCGDDCDRLSSEERSFCAGLNAGAAKFAIASSSFEIARTYISMGIKLLDASRWETQYALSLDLYELSASLSYMQGELELDCLQEILSNVKSFEDSLTASSLLAKILAATGKFDEASNNCLMILTTLGEAFPQEISLPFVLDELSALRPLLQDMTIDQVRSLHRMADTKKLNVMKFLNLLSSYAIRSKPLLSPLVSARMVRLTLEYGFSDYSLVGLVMAGYSLFQLTKNNQLVYRIGKICESLIDESPNKNALRARLCHEWYGNIKLFFEPIHAVVNSYPELCNSSMLIGDVESAVHTRSVHCIANICIGGQKLSSVIGNIEACISEATKYKQDHIVHAAMLLYHYSKHLSGGDYDAEVGVKSYSELEDFCRRSPNALLRVQCCFWQVAADFWDGEYKKVAELSDRREPPQHKTMSGMIRTFYEGISFLHLARESSDNRWKVKGEEAIRCYLDWASVSKWNALNKLSLLQAELHYVNGDLELAEAAFKESISSAREHKWHSEEALAYELYGLFCVENGLDNGVTELQLALDRYEKWGAVRKANELRSLIDGIDSFEEHHHSFSFE